MDDRPIGIFDSGLGGLSCVSALGSELPGESIIYFGDTARTPYGDKDADTIQHFTDQITDFLISQDVKMLVIACNTVSALCTNRLREKHPNIPVIGIIEPTVSHLVCAKAIRKNVGIIATKATIKSGVYETLLREKNLDSPLFSKACPLFVPLIENGFHRGVVVESVIRHYLDTFIEGNEISTLVLGCTHYPFFQESIRKLYPEVAIVNPSEIIIGEISRVLEERDIRARQNAAASQLFFASDLSETFLEMIQEITQNVNVAAQFKAFKGGYGAV